MDLTVLDPRTGDPVTRMPIADASSCEDAIARSRGAYGAAGVLTADMARAHEVWRTLPVGTVKINDVFGGAPGGAAQPRRAGGGGFGFGPELLDEMTTMKVVHWSPPGGCAG